MTHQRLAHSPFALRAQELAGVSVFLVAAAAARHPPDEPVEDGRESHDDRPAASHRQVVIPRRQLAHVHATVQQFPHRVEVVVSEK